MTELIVHLANRFSHDENVVSSDKTAEVVGMAVIFSLFCRPVQEAVDSVRWRMPTGNNLARQS